MHDVGTDEQLDLSVVVPSFGHRGHLEDVVHALAAQRPRVREIVVSHSGAGEPQLAAEGLAVPVRVLHSEARLYSGAARNRGVQTACGRWLAFVDDDVIPETDWSDRLARVMNRADAGVCVVGAIDHDTTGGYWGLCLWFVEFGSIHRYLPGRPIEGGASANMLVHRDLFERCGRFSETLRRSVDVEFMARCRSHGATTRFDPSFVVRHRNIPGLRHCLAHCAGLGTGSARVRRGSALRASALASHPLAAPLLLPARTLLMVHRVARWGRGQRLRFAFLFPGIVLSLTAWACGFAAASRENGR